MKASLVLKMGQHLTMTPQLQQAIRLLQMSTLDLQEEIQEALDSNPMLERQEEGDAPSDDRNSNDDSSDYNASSQQNTPQEAPNSAENLADANEWNEQIPSELEIDTSWEDIYQTSASSLPSASSEEWDFTSTTSRSEEHTSELQSRPHLVCRLLLEKKNKTEH